MSDDENGLLFPHENIQFSKKSIENQENNNDNVNIIETTKKPPLKTTNHNILKLDRF